VLLPDQLSPVMPSRITPGLAGDTWIAVPRMLTSFPADSTVGLNVPRRGPFRWQHTVSVSIQVNTLTTKDNNTAVQTALGQITHTCETVSNLNAKFNVTLSQDLRGMVYRLPRFECP
jgi:hypothetical protein